MKLLEILIPTFQRPESAAQAIESVLACNDDRISARCNSNGYEPKLEKYRYVDERVVYDCFHHNKGAPANAHRLLTSTEAKFCMLLSDEDRLNALGANGFLDYLQGLDDGVVVVSSSIYDVEKKNYLPARNKRFVGRRVGINEYLMFSPIPTYMSGLVFRVSELRAIDLDVLLRPSLGNAYAHLDISLTLLKSGLLDFYHPQFVEKGKELKFGGDGYSHIKAKEKSSTNFFDDHEGNLNLNPEVYGPKARARQFYYQEKLLNFNSTYANKFSFLMAKVNLIASFQSAIVSSTKDVRLSKNINILDQGRVAYQEALEADEISNTLACKYFRATSYFPLGLFILNARLLRLFSRYLRAIILRLFY